LHSNSNDNNHNNNNKKNNGAWCFPAVAAPPAVAAAFLCYDVLGTKLGGALLLCMCQKAMPFVIGGRAGARCKVARLKAFQSDRKATPKAAKKMFFSRVSEATVGSFSGNFWDVLGAKLGGVSAFRVVSISRAVARCKVARLKASKRQESYAKGSPKIVFFLGFQKRR
jgi:hypothetical protein